jgi:transcriptional regulator with XRE-family HTH domain
VNGGGRTGAEKVAEQQRLYGEPVGDLVRRVTNGLGLTQARVAGVLGLSPAMLSQLMSGQRVKIGNPQAVSRLQALLALADEAPQLTRDAIAERLDRISASQSSLTTSQLAATPPADTADVVRRLLRAVASGQELDAAARALEDVAPGLAEVIRIYGTGAREDAARHLATVAHLL